VNDELEMTWKQSWPILLLSQNFHLGKRESISNFIQDSQSLGQNLNPGHPNFKARVLNT
jgi:hypothetical protein